MTEEEIRTDERAKCAAWLDEYARDYAERMRKLLGGTRAKAEAWNFLVAAQCLRSGDPPQHPSAKERPSDHS